MCILNTAKMPRYHGEEFFFNQIATSKFLSISNYNWKRTRIVKDKPTSRKRMFLRGLECYYFIYIFSFKDVTLCYVAELDAICFVYVCFNFFPNDIGRSCWWPNLVA